jgi:hypothetical protein
VVSVVMLRRRRSDAEHRASHGIEPPTKVAH